MRMYVEIDKKGQFENQAIELDWTKRLVNGYFIVYSRKGGKFNR